MGSRKPCPFEAFEQLLVCVEREFVFLVDVLDAGGRCDQILEAQRRNVGPTL
jgi:hypothetical protein